MKTPFKSIDCPEGIALAFEAEFPLPDDGCGPNTLVFQVFMESADAQECAVEIYGRTFKETHLGSFVTRVSNLGNVLYGFARTKQITVLEII